MKKTLSAVSLVLALSAQPVFANEHAATPVLETYAQLVYANYSDALSSAVKLQQAVDALLADPSERTLLEARRAWVESRLPYLQTEAFRFYEGPIDFVDDKAGTEGPEGKLNAWPLNEAYIDYVEGNPKAGIINDESVTISRESLEGKNQEKDEADVATGYHAIEFLLWGQDLNKDGPGNRSYKDFEKGDAIKERRRTYLKTVTDMAVDDLKFLAGSWEAGKDNYAASFTKEGNKSVERILTALATLSGFELASERMATALDSGDQEDEHSCFSDTTHNDFIYNAKGISNVYFGTYGSVKGASVHDLLKAKDAKLADELSSQLAETQALMEALPRPIDREILASPANSKARKAMEAAVASLQKQAELFKQAGKALGLDVKIAE